jgi:hypothetical protein
MVHNRGQHDCRQKRIDRGRGKHQRRLLKNGSYPLGLNQQVVWVGHLHSKLVAYVSEQKRTARPTTRSETDHRRLDAASEGAALKRGRSHDLKLVSEQDLCLATFGAQAIMPPTSRTVRPPLAHKPERSSAKVYQDDMSENVDKAWS